jgi:VIT1/CCC1 family predicted Fe2+/Mn2+ transporter
MGSVMNPMQWLKREKFIAMAAGVSVVAGSIVLLHSLFPLHDRLSAVLVGVLVGGLSFSVEVLAVSLSRRPPGRRLNMLTRHRAPLK